MATISAGSLKSAIDRATKGKWVDGSLEARFLGIWDSQMYVPTLQELTDYVRFANSIVSMTALKASDDGFDCEDYAFCLMALARLRAAQRGVERSAAVGIAFGMFSWQPGEPHCCNWVVIDEGGEQNMYWLEPQDVLTNIPGAIELRSFKKGDHKLLKVMIA